MGVNGMTLSTVDLNLPWSCAENGTTIVDADGAPAAYGLSLDETPAIVRAVNNHDALVAALQEAVRQIEYMQEKFTPTATGATVIARSNSLLASLE